MIKQNLVSAGLLVILLTTNVSPAAAQAQKNERAPVLVSIIKSLTNLISSPVARRPGGGRGPLLLFSPGIWATEIWHTQPMLIWQNAENPALQPNMIEILNAQNTVVWRQSIQSASFVALAIKSELQPGQTYQVQFSQWSNEKTKFVPSSPPISFRVMSNEQRQKITQQLHCAEATLPKRLSAEISQQRIKVFVENHLWSDALQELNSVDLPIGERQLLTQEVITNWLQHQVTQAK
ncbi:MAG: DUF928 domain-containing protein [Nostocaceae cyanobacterium]|nr:DUF928 domain-containing protein [Nostocaceae cyanobacterium]